MGTTLETNARNAAANAVGSLLDNGTIEFQTSSGTVVATVTLGAPAFAPAVDGVITANAIGSDTDVAGGEITQFVFKTSGGVPTMRGPVAVSGAPINMTSTTLAAGEVLNITSLTYAQPASA